jgi:hypothetical protein
VRDAAVGVVRLSVTEARSHRRQVHRTAVPARLAVHMTSNWVVQANPASYKIDGALRELTEISWRVPQYTGVISPGDGVVIWRSGPDAGVVGVGRVTGFPAEGIPSPRTTGSRRRPPRRHGRPVSPERCAWQTSDPRPLSRHLRVGRTTRSSRHRWELCFPLQTSSGRYSVHSCPTYLRSNGRQRHTFPPPSRGNSAGD